VHANAKLRLVALPAQGPHVETRIAFAHDQAIVLCEFVRRGRRAALVQVTRRGDQHALVARQPPPDPFRCSPAMNRPEPHGAVVALDGEIGQFLGELQLHLQQRMALLEVGQCRAEPQAAEAERGRQADHARGLRALFAQVGLELREALQQLRRAFAQGFALGRGQDAARGALEQPEAQPRFECRQFLGDDRRHDAGGRGGRSQAAVRAYRQQQLEIGAVEEGVQLLPIWKELIAGLLLAAGPHAMTESLPC